MIRAPGFSSFFPGLFVLNRNIAEQFERGVYALAPRNESMLATQTEKGRRSNTEERVRKRDRLPGDSAFETETTIQGTIQWRENG